MTEKHDGLPVTGNWGQLYGCSQAEAIVRAAVDSRSPVLVVAPDMRAARQFEIELRFFARGEIDIFLLPDWEILPYDLLSPGEEVIARRIDALRRLPAMRSGICVTVVDVLLQYLAPTDFICNTGFSLAVGDQLDLEKFRRELADNCYLPVTQVTEHGEYAVRGCVVDVFPPASELPVRIDLLDDQIESLRMFSPENQASIKKVGSVTFQPAREFLLNEATVKAFRRRFRESIDDTDSRLYHDISNGIIPGGIEYYLPLFFADMATLFDYVPPNVTIFTPAGLPEHIGKHWRLIRERYEQARMDEKRPLLNPKRLFLDGKMVADRMRKFGRVTLQSFESDSSDAYNGETCLLPPVSMKKGSSHPLENLERFLEGFSGRVLITALSRGYLEQIRDMLRKNGFNAQVVGGWSEFRGSDKPLCICIGDIHTGVEFTRERLAIVSDNQILGKQERRSERRTGRTPDATAIIHNLGDLAPGCPVVHEEHGVGRYRSLKHLGIGGNDFEFLVLEYADGDKLYVPVSSLHLVTRYTGGNAETAPLHKLGDGQWKKTRKKAAQKAFDVAAELLDAQARRQTVRNATCTVDDEDYREFVDAFPYEETRDQLKVMEEIRADMARPRPMDRIVCGDVGFGKTEIAMRAAFIALQNNQQVAVLVPTTLLANQHFDNFTSRFADWPVRIGLLSRFSSPGSQRRTIEELARGTVDIVIGTHRLLTTDIPYKKLGLIVTDEEQRFGVRQKERLKLSASDSNLLTLSATPIPRTLNMSLSKLRDLSLIAVPPPGRRPIKTFVNEWNDTLVSEICQRELHRGGQIYFIHNRVADIEEITDRLRGLLPGLDIRFAHGQMQKRHLESVMLNFYRQRFNMLVCTTIIESGIDIPSANSIIINGADHFGLAQLHQLRGRVGRSHYQAYAYFALSKPLALLQEDARKRLEAVESLEKLGTGFTLAMHDLEIRGAGELLGEEQSGQIQQVGFALYNSLLRRAVDVLRSGRIPNADEPLNLVTEVDLGEPAFIPENYIPDVNLRLVLYRRIAAAMDEAKLAELKAEMIDRFGSMPPQSVNLFKNAEIRFKCFALNIRKVEVTNRNGSLYFGETPRVDVDHLISFVRKRPAYYRFGDGNRLIFDTSSVEVEDRAEAVHELLGRISQKQQAA